jgi:hypothetical protein
MKTQLYNARKWNHTCTRTGNEMSLEWDSLEAFWPDAEYVKKASPVQFRETCGYAEGSGGEAWLGISGGYKAFEAKMQQGWPELRTMLEKRLADIELDVPRFPSQTETRRRRMRRSDEGDSLDQERVWSGDLDHAWTRPIKETRVAPNTKCITLLFEVGAHCGITNEQAMWRAALCMLLVRSLAQAGRTFEIWVQSSQSGGFTNRLEHSSDYPSRCWYSWIVKKAAEPVVMDRLCSMVSIGMLRTYGFVAYDCTPFKLGYGYGSPMNSGMPHSLRERQKRGEVVLRIGECYTKTECLSEYKRAWGEVESAIQGAAA